MATLEGRQSIPPKNGCLHNLGLFMYVQPLENCSSSVLDVVHTDAWGENVEAGEVRKRGEIWSSGYPLVLPFFLNILTFNHWIIFMFPSQLTKSLSGNNKFTYQCVGLSS